MADGTRPNDRKKALMAAQLLMLGETHTKTAKLLEISATTLTNWKNGPAWPDYVAKAKSIPANEMLAYRARAKLFELLDSPDDKVALKAVMHVMDNTDFLPAALAVAAQEAAAAIDELEGLDDMSDEELREAAGLPPAVELDFATQEQKA